MTDGTTTYEASIVFQACNEAPLLAIRQVFGDGLHLYERERGAGEIEAFAVDEPDFQNVEEAIDALMGSVPEAAMQLPCEKTMRIAVYSVTFTTTIRMDARNLRRLQGLQLEISVYPTSA